MTFNERQPENLATGRVDHRGAFEQPDGINSDNEERDDFIFKFIDRLTDY